MGKVKGTPTLKQNYYLLLEDLIKERKQKGNEDSWNYRLDQKIAEMKLAIKEKGY